jgi:2-polyprenyl-3-methyl-5-hydroxy-6-metoxy-1,4-benzoquinol methylase
MHIYENYEETQGWSTKEFGSYSHVEAGYFTKEMSSLISATGGNQDHRVLDIGFGNGAFMGWCRDNNIRCDGLEVNRAQIDKAKSAGYTAYSNFGDISSPTYSAVAGFDVLEHIESSELVAFLSKVSQICQPNSPIFFRFPNGDNPFSLWMQNGDLTHRNFIGSGMITQAALQANLTVVKIAEPSVSYDGLPISGRAKVLAGHILRKLIGKILVALFMSGQRNIKFSPNLMVELRNG